MEYELNVRVFPDLKRIVTLEDIIADKFPIPDDFKNTNAEIHYHYAQFSMSLTKKNQKKELLFLLCIQQSQTGRRPFGDSCVCFDVKPMKGWENSLIYNRHDDRVEINYSYNTMLWLIIEQEKGALEDKLAEIDIALLDVENEIARNRQYYNAIIDLGNYKKQQHEIKKTLKYVDMWLELYPGGTEIEEVADE